PHVLQRLPGCFPSLEDTTASWSALARLRAPEGIAPLKAHQFAGRPWLSRDAYWWPKLTSDESVRSAQGAWPVKRPRYVFLEDKSCFVEESEAREFLSDVGGFFDRRYVSKDGEVDVIYVPSSSFA